MSFRKGRASRIGGAPLEYVRYGITTVRYAAMPSS